MWHLDSYPLAEEIGDPDLFVGREQEMARLLEWAAWRLGGFTDAEALEAVYNYAYTYQVAITEETAPYIARVCGNDPFYIAATVANQPGSKDLTTEQGVRDALTFETVTGQGEIAYTWGEYLADAIERVNDQDAHRIVLYLAKHEPEERDRTQIHRDLALEMTDKELETWPETPTSGWQGQGLRNLTRARIAA